MNAAPTPQQVADAMSTLEHDIACLSSMTKILGELLDQYLVDREDNAQSGKDLYTVLLGNMEMDMLSFAWNDVIARAGRLDRAFRAAIEGRVVQ